MIDWIEVSKVAFGCIAAFGGGWATAILSGTEGSKSIAAGVVSATTYYLGNRQKPADFKG